MTASVILAHGGAAGLALELGLLVVPILAFVALAWWTAKKNRAEEADSPGGGQ